jgi:hypothetical protein
VQDGSRHVRLHEQCGTAEDREAGARGETDECAEQRDVRSAQAHGRVEPIAHGAAGERCQTEVVTECECDERNEGCARVWNASADVAQSEDVIQSEQPITARSQDERCKHGTRLHSTGFAEHILQMQAGHLCMHDPKRSREQRD